MFWMTRQPEFFFLHVNCKKPSAIQLSVCHPPAPHFKHGHGHVWLQKNKMARALMPNKGFKVAHKSVNVVSFFESRKPNIVLKYSHQEHEHHLLAKLCALQFCLLSQLCSMCVLFEQHKAKMQCKYVNGDEL